MSKRLLTSGSLSVVIEGDDIDAEIIRAFQEAPPKTQLGILFQLSNPDGSESDSDEFGDTVGFLEKHGMLRDERGQPLPAESAKEN